MRDQANFKSKVEVVLIILDRNFQVLSICLQAFPITVIQITKLKSNMSKSLEINMIMIIKASNTAIVYFQNCCELLAQNQKARHDNVIKQACWLLPAAVSP